MVTIDTPEGAAEDLRRLGRLDTDELAELRDGLRDARLDTADEERRLSRPIAPGRAATRKQRLRDELAEVKRTLLRAEAAVLEEQLARYDHGDDDGGAA